MKTRFLSLFILALLSLSCSQEKCEPEPEPVEDKNFPKIDFSQINVSTLPELTTLTQFKGKIVKEDFDLKVNGYLDPMIRVEYANVSPYRFVMFVVKNNNISAQIIYRGNYLPPVWSDNLVKCQDDEKGKIKSVATYLREGNSDNFAVIIRGSGINTTFLGSQYSGNFMKLKSYSLFKIKKEGNEEFQPGLLLKFEIKMLDEMGNHIITGEGTFAYVPEGKTCS